MRCGRSDDTDDELFSFTSTTSSHRGNGIDQELELYLSDESKQLDSLDKFPHVKELFLRFNIGIPSSALVERLFSAGGQILTPRSSGLSDDHYEMMLLLKSNKALK